MFRVNRGGRGEFCLVVTVEKPNEKIMDSKTDYERYDGLGLAGLVKDVSVSAAELLEAAIERVEQRNPAINAVVDRMYDQAKAAIAAGLPSGPFSGVPFLLKISGRYTQAQSRPSATRFEIYSRNASSARTVAGHKQSAFK